MDKVTSFSKFIAFIEKRGFHHDITNECYDACYNEYMKYKENGLTAEKWIELITLVTDDKSEMYKSFQDLEFWLERLTQDTYDKIFEKVQDLDLHKCVIMLSFFCLIANGDYNMIHNYKNINHIIEKLIDTSMEEKKIDTSLSLILNSYRKTRNSNKKIKEFVTNILTAVDDYYDC